MAIKWTPQMSVGEETIDNQHKKLINQLNEQRKILAGSLEDMSSIRESINFFAKYATEHFTYEEEYMEKHKYPQIKKHRKIHQSFVKYYIAYREKFYKKYKSKDFSSEKIKELLNESQIFLENWLVSHILTEDQKYVKYIADKKKKAEDCLKK